MVKRNLNWIKWVAAATLIPKILNDAAFNNAKPIKNPLNGEYKIFQWKNNNIFYTRWGHGETLLLVHGIGAGASSYVWRKNFDELSKHFSVYAIDLLGFGFSDRPKLNYSAELMSNIIYDFVRFEIKATANIIASSLSAAYALKAAAKNNEYFNKLVLICPSGIVKLDEPSGHMYEKAYRTMKSPYIGTSLYNMMTSKPLIRKFLENNMYYDKNMVTDEMVEHYYNSCHFKGLSSKYAVAAFLGGHLNGNVKKELENTQKPILTIWGKNSKLSPDEEAIAFEKFNPKVKTIIYENCGISPQEENFKEFNKDVIAFLKS